jgi:hypothetical protein
MLEQKMNITKMWSACASAFGVAFLLAVSTAHAQDTTIVIGDEAGQPGADIDLPVFLEANNHQAAGLDIHIEFDENELDLRSGGSVGPCEFVDPGPALDSGQTMICNDEGGGRLFVGIDAPVTFPVPEISEGIMFFVRFTVAASATTGAATDVTHDPATVLVANTTGTSVPSDDVTVENGEIEVSAGPPADLVFDPVSGTDLTFSAQQSTTDTETVQICNDGDPDSEIDITDISVTTTDNAGGNFSEDNNCPGTLGDDECCTVTVTFNSENGGDATSSGNLSVETSEGDGSWDLSGTSTDGPQPALDVDPTAVDFGTVDGNDLPQSENVTVTNDGDADSTLEISSVGYTGDGAFTINDGCEGASLEQGQSCIIEVVFDTEDDGTYSGSISIESNAGDETVSVDGERDSVASLSNDLGETVDVGSGLQGETVSTDGTFSNSGSADGDFDCTITDDTDGVFSTDPDPLSGTVEANGTFDFTLSCALPMDAEDGDTFTATLSCSGDEGFSSEHELSCNVDEFEPLPVPTMQTWSLILFALMMLLAGGLSIRFFRAG